MNDCWLCMEPVTGERMNGGHPWGAKTDDGWYIGFVSHPECFETYRMLTSPGIIWSRLDHANHLTDPAG